MEYLPNQPQVESKDNNCRQENDREQDPVFLKIPERDQRDQNGRKDIACGIGILGPELINVLGGG